MAEESVVIPEHKGALLVTVGHVCERKGVDFAIDAAQIMHEKGIEFLWLWLGTNDNPKYEDQVQKLGLDKKFRFVGVCSNPYPYMKQADIIVHPSRYEGKSMTLDEAKILCKPIVVTNFSTVYDQFRDKEDASVCEMDSMSLSDSISSLINDAFLRSRYTSSLLRESQAISNCLPVLNSIL